MPTAAQHETQLQAATLGALLGMVRRHTGIAMAERKSVLLQGRLAPRLRQLELGSYEQYLALLQAGGPEVQVFIDMVTTNDTQFFRTPAVWEWFAHSFLPQWRAGQDGDGALRIWSAAAASGEEAWSAAMLCHQFQQLHPAFRFRILGSDISGAALATASAGRYSGRSAERLRASHPQLAASYFRDSEDTLAVLPELRQYVQFVPHNLFDAWGAGQQFDLVLLRNVLIYFDEDNQRRVLARVRQAMAPQARLVIGEQESITRLATPLCFEQTHIYRRGDGDA